MKEKRAFSPDHLKVLDSIFGTGNLDEADIPDPTELTPEYFDTRYPKKTPEQIKEDRKKGFVCFRPNWWDDPANKSIVGADGTWGTAYRRSMQMEAKRLFETSAQIFSESIQKPNYTDSSQHYGSEEGTDQALDPLLPIIHKVFGEKANRFNHSHDELIQRLVPKVEEKIRQQFKAKGLSVPSFKVMLEPAIIFNRQTMEKHPANSTTTTWERSSTILLTQDNKDSGRRLLVGGADSGGAGHVNNDHRDARIDDRGFRLAVVLEK